MLRKYSTIFNRVFKITKSLLVVAIGLVILMQCKQKQSAPYVLKASLLVNENHTWYKGFVYFQEILEKRSGGQIKLEVYHSEQLAKEIEAIRLIQAGVIDMTITGSMLNNWMEIAVFCELPFLLRDSVDMKQLINGPVGRRIEHEMVTKTGLRPLGYFQRGPRHLTSNRPIKHPDDLNGLILRVPNVPSFVTTWSALGAKPTPMAFSEVFTSLQQGTVEAQENPFALIKSAGFSEVQRYINLTAHVVSWGYPVIGEKQFRRMPDDLQEIFLKAASDMQQYEHQLFLDGEKSVQQALKDKGMQFIEVDKDAFNNKSKTAIYESLSPEMRKVYHRVLEDRK